MAGNICPVHGYTGHSPDEASAAIPKGGIIMWSGVNIPVGWLLCDGTNGTPDLREKFIMAAGGSVNIGDSGGALTHAHTVPSLSHTGTAVADHAALTHSGTAVSSHENHKHQMPLSVGSSAIRTPGGTHPFGAGDDVEMQKVTQLSDGTFNLAYSMTDVESATLTHSVTQPSSHSAQSHTVTQPSDHAQQTSSTGSSIPPYYALAFIMKG